MGRVKRVVVCQYCGCQIRRPAAICRRCKTPHHQDCFRENGQCTTYACGSRSFIDGATGRVVKLGLAVAVGRAGSSLLTDLWLPRRISKMRPSPADFEAEGEGPQRLVYRQRGLHRPSRAAYLLGMLSLALAGALAIQPTVGGSLLVGSAFAAPLLLYVMARTLGVNEVLGPAYRVSKRFLFLFYVFFILAGVGIATASQAFVAWLLSLVLVCHASVLASERLEVYIDREARRLTGVVTTIFAVSQDGQSLDDFRRVVLLKAEGQPADDERAEYRILLASDDSRSLEFGSVAGGILARRCAERIAGFVGLPLVDVSQGAQVVRQAGELDELLVERLAHEGGGRPPQPAPERLRSWLSTEGDRCRIELPGPALTCGQTLWAAAVGVVGATGIVTLVKLSMVLDAVIHVAVPVLVVLLGNWARRRIRSTAVEASPRGLSVIRRGLLYDLEERFPVDELEELLIIDLRQASRTDSRRLAGDGTRRLMARSDRKQARVGQGLSLSELEWVKSVLEAALMSGRHALPAGQEAPARIKAPPPQPR